MSFKRASSCYSAKFFNYKVLFVVFNNILKIAKLRFSAQECKKGTWKVIFNADKLSILEWLVYIRKLAL